MFAQATADVFHGPAINWTALSPLIVLLVGGLVLMIAAALTPKWPRNLYAFFTAAIGMASLVLAIVLWHRISVDGSIGLVGMLCTSTTSRCSSRSPSRPLSCSPRC